MHSIMFSEAVSPSSSPAEIVWDLSGTSKCFITAAEDVFYAEDIVVL